MHHVVVDPKFWVSVEDYFPLPHDDTLTSHDFAELELVEIQNRLRHDFYGDTRPGYFADPTVRTFDIERSLVFDRRIAVYCAEGDDGIVRILKLEIEL